MPVFSSGPITPDQRRKSRRAFLAAFVGSALAWPAWPTVARAQVPIVAAASDLQPALDELRALFSTRTGQTVELVFGSTGNLARQIQQGAPFELFLAADESFIFALHRGGFLRDEGVVYGLGRLVLAARESSPLEPDPELIGLARLLAEGRLQRFAIANPLHAPYGARAREVLLARGLWAAIEPFLVYGENVSQAAAFALSGQAEGGLIALALALAPTFPKEARFALIPDQWHSPLRQRMALVAGAGPVAQAFFEFLSEPEARLVFERFGFTRVED